MNKNEIIAYLKEHPDWILQYCFGVRDGWWWLRSTTNSSDTITVDGRSAVAAKKMLVVSKAHGWRATNYILP